MVMWTKTKAAGVLAGGVLLLGGCAGFFPPLPVTTTTTSGSTAGDFVYVANQTTGSIAAFQVATSTAGVGSLTAVSGSPYALSTLPTAIAITPANSFLYVAQVGAIYVYSINTSTGVLTVANSANAVAVTLPSAKSLDISPDGQWLFALSSDNLTLEEFQINASTGALTPQATVSYTPAKGGISVASMVKVAPNGAYVFLALGTGGELVFPFTTSTGVLGTTAQGLTTGGTTTSDNALAIDSTTSFLYVARSGAGGGLVVFTVGTGGSLTQVAGSPYATGAGPFAVQLDSTGKFLYTANRTDATISGFTIGTGGVLTALAGSPFASGSGVTALARDNSAKYVLAAAEGGSPDLTLYSFDSTTAGKLDTAASVSTGLDPAGAIALVATQTH